MISSLRKLGIVTLGSLATMAGCATSEDEPSEPTSESEGAVEVLTVGSRWIDLTCMGSDNSETLAVSFERSCLRQSCAASAAQGSVHVGDETIPLECTINRRGLETAGVHPRVSCTGTLKSGRDINVVVDDTVTSRKEPRCVSQVCRGPYETANGWPYCSCPGVLFLTSPHLSRDGIDHKRPKIVYDHAFSARLEGSADALNCEMKSRYETAPAPAGSCTSMVGLAGRLCFCMYHGICI